MMPPQRKRRLLIRLLSVSLYFAIWFTFGLLYRSAADATHGGAFIQQGDLRTENRISKIKELGRFKVDDNVVRDVLSNDNVSERKPMPFFRDKDVFLLFDRPLGRYWAAYYQNRAEKLGISNFSFLTKGAVKEEKKIYYKIIIAFYRHPVSLSEGAVATAYHRIWQLAPDPMKTTIYLVPNAEQVKSWKAEKHQTIWLDADPTALCARWLDGFPEEIRKVGVYPIANLDEIMEQAVSDPEGSVFLCQDVRNRNYRCPLVDRLYFSAVTIAP